ncbi:MAG: hypothetical protein ABSG15_04640 [FCB group bacterium]|jgi:hypothetical protein
MKKSFICSVFLLIGSVVIIIGCGTQRDANEQFDLKHPIIFIYHNTTMKQVSDAIHVAIEGYVENIELKNDSLITGNYDISDPKGKLKLVFRITTKQDGIGIIISTDFESPRYISMDSLTESESKEIAQKWADEIGKDGKLYGEYPYSIFLNNVNLKQVKDACLDDIKGDGTSNRYMSSMNDSLIEMHHEGTVGIDNYDITWKFIIENGGIRLFCKSNVKGYKAGSAEIWGKGVAKRLGIEN